MKVGLILQKIISGGQAGVDQVGLKVARALGYQTGGTAPKGWRTENGAAPWLANYGLVESCFSDYRARTIANVCDADQTVWFGTTSSPGAKLTIGTARRLGKPVLINPDATTLRAVLSASYPVYVLNVAGNRLRMNPGASKQARAVLTEALIQDWTKEDDNESRL